MAVLREYDGNGIGIAYDTDRGVWELSVLMVNVPENPTWLFDPTAGWDGVTRIDIWIAIATFPKREDAERAMRMVGWFAQQHKDGKG